VEVGLSFERPTGLAAQLQKNDLNRQDIIYFKDLRTHYEKMVRHYKDPVPAFTFSKSLSAYGIVSGRKTIKAEFEQFESSVSYSEEIIEDFDPQGR
jgi:hypothetical protein